MYNITPVNNSPIDVDYNHMDEDGGIVLDTRGSIASIERLQIDLKEGLPIWISDGELEYLAVLIRRRDNWVAVTIYGTRKDV